MKNEADKHKSKSMQLKLGPCPRNNEGFAVRKLL